MERPVQATGRASLTLPGSKPGNKARLASTLNLLETGKSKDWQAKLAYLARYRACRVKLSAETAPANPNVQFAEQHMGPVQQAQTMTGFERAGAVATPGIVAGMAMKNPYVGLPVGLGSMALPFVTHTAFEPGADPSKSIPAQAGQAYKTQQTTSHVLNPVSAATMAPYARMWPWAPAAVTAGMGIGPGLGKSIAGATKGDFTAVGEGMREAGEGVANIPVQAWGDAGARFGAVTAVNKLAPATGIAPAAPGALGRLAYAGRAVRAGAPVMLAANAAATLNNAARLGLTEEGGDELAATARQQALADQQRGEVGRGLATIGDLSTAFLTGDPTAGAARIADLTSQDVRDMKANTVLEAQATEHFQNQLEQFKSYYTKLMPTVPQGTVDNLAEMAAQNSYRNFMRAGSAGTQVRSGRQTNRHLGGDDQFAQLANQLGRQIGQASLLRKDDEGNFSGVLQDPGVRQALEMAAQRGELPQPPETPQHVYYSDR